MKDILDDPFEEKKILNEFGQKSWRSFKFTFVLLLILLIVSLIASFFPSKPPFIQLFSGIGLALLLGIFSFWMISMWYSLKSIIEREKGDYQNRSVLIISFGLFLFVAYLSLR